jgi:hypothetical protein
MADNSSADKGVVIQPGRTPFPAVRLLYAIGFAFIAWFVVHLIILLAVVQFAVVALTGRVNEELKDFSFHLVQYLWELLAFVSFVSNDQPFPLGPFPRRR